MLQVSYKGEQSKFLKQMLNKPPKLEYAQHNYILMHQPLSQAFDKSFFLPDPRVAGIVFWQ
jgi:hypothetical protein